MHFKLYAFSLCLWKYFPSDTLQYYTVYIEVTSYNYTTALMINTLTIDCIVTQHALTSDNVGRVFCPGNIIKLFNERTAFDFRVNVGGRGEMFPECFIVNLLHSDLLAAQKIQRFAQEELSEVCTKVRKH